MKLPNIVTLPAHRPHRADAVARQCIVRNLTFNVDREHRGLRVHVVDASTQEPSRKDQGGTP
jgi:hypothetical protein